MRYVFKDVEIKSEYFGFKEWPCDSTNTNYHKILLRNLKTKKHTHFDFWASKAHPRIEDEKDLLEAFECFLTDAMAGDMEFEQFCQEFGYDVYREDGYPNANAKRIWKKCRISREKFDRIFDGMNLYEVLNEIHDMLD